tara:strand:+ start:369 stop:659 length:291 start_codon:yes stop_codon:yes gene_type:complete
MTNAKTFIKIQEEFGSFNCYIWQFTDGKTIRNQFKKLSEITSTSTQSDKMSIELKARGFKFICITICYAFMQASGMVNYHKLDCFRCEEIQKISFN